MHTTLSCSLHWAAGPETPLLVGGKHFVVPRKSALLCFVTQGGFRLSNAIGPCSFLSLKNGYFKVKDVDLKDVDNASPAAIVSSALCTQPVGPKLLSRKLMSAHRLVCLQNVFILHLEWVILHGRFASLTCLKRLENVAELDLYSLVAEWQWWPVYLNLHIFSSVSASSILCQGHLSLYTHPVPPTCTPTLLHPPRSLPELCRHFSLAPSRLSNTYCERMNPLFLLALKISFNLQRRKLRLKKLKYFVQGYTTTKTAEQVFRSPWTVRLVVFPSHLSNPTLPRLSQSWPGCRLLFKVITQCDWLWANIITRN